MFRKRASVVWCAVGLMVGTGMVFAQFGGGPPTPEPKPAEQRLFPGGLPKIELMLKSALENHPDVLAARGKVRSAEAEQRQAELKALKDVMDVRDRWEKAHRSLTGLGPTHPSMREHLNDLAAIEWELSFLLGTRNEPRLASESTETPAKPVAPTPGSQSPQKDATDTDISLPRGEQAKSMRAKLGETIQMEIDDTPLKDVAEYLSERTGLRFILDSRSLENGGIPADSPITLKLGELELGAALQALEDLQSPLCFIVRDYGILVTVEGSQAVTSVTARDFWKLTDEEILEKQRQKQARLNSATGVLGGFGGMSGGGMGGGGGLF